MGILVIDPRDNVAVALASVEPGMTLQAGDTMVRALDTIPAGHKIALRDIPAGAPVIKYGEAIGRAKASILAGSHVHVHNLDSLRGRGDLV
ncbi:MAG: UxaA family hydrolase [Bacillota bacterium]|jgi:altronate dehydratase|nr:UxaA family hydrolase [Bacillota bacterium]